MSIDRHDETRRRFLRLGAIGVAGLSLAGWVTAWPADAADAEKLSEDDPAAKALGYVQDASRAGGTHQSGAACRNCSLYTGDRNAQWGTCSVFPGKLVNTGGWCSAWVKAG